MHLWRNGRRARFRTVSEQSGGGSSPLKCTTLRASAAYKKLYSGLIIYFHPMPKKPSAPKVSKATKTVAASVVSGDTPSTIKWAKGLAIFQIVVSVLALAFFLWLFASTSTDPFIQGMQQGVMEEFGETLSFEATAEMLGAITAMFTMALIGPILILVAISRRTKNWAIASLVFNGLLLVTSFSLVTIAIVALMLVEPSRRYLNFNNA